MITLPHNIQDQIIISDEDTKERLLLVGAPGSGKTTSALTFPNPLVLDLDKKVPVSTNTIPFWSEAFIRTYLKQERGRPNKRDAIKKWLNENVKLLPENITLIIDSWSMIQHEFNAQADYDPSPYLTQEKDGNQKLNTFAIYKHKMLYSAEICNILRRCQCHVVVTCHEQRERDEKGNITGLIKPLQEGQFADQMAAYFTSVFRCVIIKIDNTDVYKWQIVSSADNFYAIRPPGMKADEKYLEPSYKALRKARGLNE